MKIHKLVPRGLLKYNILRLLEDGPKHGYEIMKLMEKKTGWEPSPGTIYPTLHKLKEKGFITDVKSKNKKRISYRITKKGRNLSKKIEMGKKEMKNKICNFIETIGQIIDMDETEMKSLFEMHRNLKGDEIFHLPDKTRKYLIKTKSLSLKLIKDKSKQKKMNKIIEETYEKLKKLERE